MIDRAVLQDYLRDRWSDPQLRVTDFEEVPGGKSKETILTTVVRGTSETTRLVVRADRSASPLSSKATDEFAVIDAVHRYGGVPCAQPLLHEPDPSILGGTALISERVDGTRAGQFFPELEKPQHHGRELMNHLATALARLHTMPLELLADTHLDTTPKPMTAAALDQSVLELADMLAKGRGPDVACIQIAVDWLRRHLEYVPEDTPRGLNHGDIGLHNILIRDGEVTAFLDWELPHVGPIACELATVHTAVTSLTPWDAFVETYLAAGGPPRAVDRRTIAFYRVHKALWLLWYSRAASHLYWSGARRDIISAGVSFDSQFRHRLKVARALDNAIEVAWP
jgi:aminoglycoside phosphotransferase (APT) family kinase protein